MEVKVWVDGLQRVVCGASWDTTCQDVVIALAHAMGRTGRFTLLEKWRENERPLTPSECPLQVLNKWGEFAAEVRFVLCQADADCSQKQQKKRSLSRDRVATARKSMEKSASMHKILSQQSQGVSCETSVKRSLTFSGAHNNPLAEDPSWMGASMPTSKVRKTQQGPVPNGDLRQQVGDHSCSPPHSPACPSLHSSSHPSPLSSTQVRQVRGVIAGSVNQISAVPPPSVATSLSSSLSPTHHPRRPSPTRHQLGEGHPSRKDPATSPSMLGSSVLSAHQLGDASRPSAFQPPLKLQHSRGASPSKGSPISEGQIQTRADTVCPHSDSQPPELPSEKSVESPQTPSKKSIAPQPESQQPHLNHISQQHQQQNEAAQLLSKAKSMSALDHQATHTKPSPVSSHPQGSNSSITHSSNLDHPNMLQFSKSTSAITDAPHQDDPLQIEEYDLEHNFPGSGGPHSHKDWNHNHHHHHDDSLESFEYRLEDGLGSGQGSGSGQGHLEGEHAKLMRLVHMQDQRLKIQESQISLLNTEISNLEEKEMEYEENLHIIMEELLLQENRHHDLEPQLHDLEEVDWERTLQEEEQHGIELTLEVASCKAALLEQDEKLGEVENKEEELLEELKCEEAKLSQHKEWLKEQEDKAREERQTRDEISQLHTQCQKLSEQSGQCESSLAQVEDELANTEKLLNEKNRELQNLEADLKQENLEDHGSSQLGLRMDITAQDSQKMLRKILEDSLSPRLFQAADETDNPPPPTLLATFTTSNQSGVWV